MIKGKLEWLLVFLISAGVLALFIPAILEARKDSIVDYINSVRVKPLKEDKFLNRLAIKRCVELTKWEHQDIWSVTYDIMWASGRTGLVQRYFYAGENLANGFSNDRDAFVALQNSPTHKSNNESVTYQKIGVGRCNNKLLGKTIVLLFAGNK